MRAAAALPLLSPTPDHPPLHTHTAPPFALPPLQTLLQYEATLTSDPIFSKTPCPAVDSTGRVLAALPTAILVSLPNPDSLPATG